MWGGREERDVCNTHPTWGCFFSKECHILSGKGEKRVSPKPNTLKSVIFIS